MSPTPTSSRPRSPSSERRPGRATGAHAALALIGAGAVLAGGALHHDERPGEPIVPQDVPPDVRAELDATWGRFTDRFAGRMGCIAAPTVVLVRDVPGGDARYLAADERIEIEIPTSPRRFRESLVHELAHHVERSCGDFEALRDALHPRFGGPERPWLGGEWEETPAELWAESVVELVNGERVRHARVMPLDRDAVEMIAAWGTGGEPG